MVRKGREPGKGDALKAASIEGKTMSRPAVAVRVLVGSLEGMKSRVKVGRRYGPLELPLLEKRKLKKTLTRKNKKGYWKEKKV